MADFVAVIRRAVDGLSDNTPEMRVKVYEKARGAVLRQLESMKPRPPEEMLRRQLDKLEAAILEVEAEHAEAIPPQEEPEIIVPEEIGPAPVPPDPEPEPVATVAADEPPAAEALVAYQPEQSEVQPVEPALPAPLPVELPVPAAPAAMASPARRSPALFGDETWAGEEEQEPAAAHEVHAEEPVAARLPESDTYVHEEPAYAPQEEEAFSDDIHPQQTEEPLWQREEEPEALDNFVVPEPTEHYSRTVSAEPDPVLAPEWPADGVGATATASVIEPEWKAEATYDAPEASSIADATPELLTAYEEAEVPVDPLAWQPEQEPVDILPMPSEFVEVATVQGELAAAQQDSYDEPVLHAQAVYDDAAPEAPAHDEPEAYVSHEAETAVLDRPRDEWEEASLHDVSMPVDDDYRSSAAPADQRSNDEEWDEFEEFSNYDRSPAREDDLLDEDFVPPAPEKPARSYRIQPKRRIDFTSIGLGLLGLAIVAASGYGAWTFRDTLSGLVTGLVSAPPSDTAKPAASTAPVKPADTNKSTAAGDSAPATQGTATSASKSASPPPDAADQNVQKFTQRLKADGTESDEGVASGASEGEGKSLAPQTVASTEPATTTPQTAPPNSVLETPAAIPAGVSQKMFLYEERVGQASPVAIEGAVVWSLKHDKAENGKEEAVVQAQVTAPERGLSALISFKRNLDPSLPASHLVELVFSLPKNFEGGAIESVQRVAMKQTEQDRGDPLVAVPAKITDDFHMIALNDYADAREFNLKLMQTRDWIDIPVTYRNGRRALITMEKGSTGTAAFNQAIAEWRTADPTASAVPANPAPGPTPAPAPAAQAAPAQAPAAPAPAPAPDASATQAPAPAANPQ